MITDTNAALSQTHTLFRKSCDLAGVKPTARQMSKWKRNEGKAIKFSREAKKELGIQ